MSSSEPIPERHVKPRQPWTQWLPIIVATPRVVFSEELDKLYTGDDLPAILSERLPALDGERHPPAIIACSHPETTLAFLHERLKDYANWQFRATPVIRESLRPDGTMAEREELIVNSFGFLRPTGRERNRYFYPIAPGQFCRQSARELVELETDHHVRLYLWAAALRTFCTRYELRPTPTGGGIAAQLLRHPRFYPDDRRKVPQATNEKAREHLPGNYYELAARRARMTRLAGRESYDPIRAAFYIDQSDAHHSAVLSVALPQSDELRARGYFRDALDGEALQPHHGIRCVPQIWIERHGPGWDALMRQHGLLLAAIDVPNALSVRSFLPPQLRREGRQFVYLYTNEIAELESCGGRIAYVSAAWTSVDADEGIRRYAQWSRDEIARRPADKKWLKPTLLAAYGILAAKPRTMRCFYWQGDGERSEMLLGPQPIQAIYRETSKELQSPIASVIQRGMIEAETRLVSLRLARELSREGFDVLAIYADALIVRDTGRPLPLIAAPWRVKERLTDLHFLNETSFRSREITRLPGVPRVIEHREVDHGHVRQGQGVRDEANGDDREAGTVHPLERAA